MPSGRGHFLVSKRLSLEKELGTKGKYWDSLTRVEADHDVQ